MLLHQQQTQADELGVSNYQIKVESGATQRYRDYTIRRLGVMVQKTEKMLPKIRNEWLCKVQLFLEV